MSPPLPLPDQEHALHLLRQMLRIRRFEEACAELYQATKIRGFLHLYIGEEAVATGVNEALDERDGLIATYREHGHALLRGVSGESIMAEMYGKQEGCSRGRGGSMHLYDVDKRFYGGNAIVAGGLPLAVGMGLAEVLRGPGDDGFPVAVVFFGEGAMAEGEFHESMNLAALWQLPVLFVCENNGYAMGTALDRSESETDLTLKASAYRMPAWPVDGMDVLATEKAARAAVAAIREGGGPHFLEMRTYRYRAHSMFDPELYRAKEEVEQWKERDPIALFDARLREAGMLDDATRDAIEAEIADEVQRAIDFAEAGTWEPLSELTRFVTSEPEVAA
jgi:pyruvate dehydrogenase E1 component alpha subunit